ncbi:serine/threonine-protein kinase [Myxacorys almedinensis]|uniref:non-specific serine/threonine protein kinase n=1 Tax=Myxacorys almedinensis A TaxID=2690445 RepID=A0A8J7Z302_9CYAN|nr:serine/threonine-protein kinase [Myxacorys almedinensis]NDJ19079.1 protein kinase [Myxacorys almedinensis A]
MARSGDKFDKQEFSFPIPLIVAMRRSLPDGTLVQNRYRVLRVLGQGGFGRTYLAQDTNRFNELCVLKEFDPQTQGAKNAQKAEELFAREAGVLYQLHHPQIPQFRELFRVKQPSGELLFLVQDYVEGKTYQDLIEERRQRGLAFSEKEVTQLLQELLPVLDYIHRAGIIHRDISPDNIILRERDQKPVLIDFGVVKAAAHQIAPSASHTFVGKPGYAPVEQIQKGKANPSSDLYALAVTIVVILTGREPQSLFDPVNLTWQWQRYASVSPRLADILDRMLSAKPSDRYASADDILQHLSFRAPDSVPPIPLPPAALVPASASHQRTVAVGRRRSSRVSVVQAHPRSWVESVFDGPAFLIKSTAKGAFKLVKRLFKLTFGLVRFTVLGLLKLGLQLGLIVAAIAALIWAAPQVFPLIAGSLPTFPPAAKRSPALPTDEQSRGDTLEARCRELGMDYGELIAAANETFYAKYPDRKGKALSGSAADKRLRDEWYRIAQGILERRKSQKEVAEN